jgi:hypothetical protein
MTVKELKKLRRIAVKEDTKLIESVLHPTPTINGIDVLHEHTKNGCVRFTAWIGNNPVRNGKQFVVKREDILSRLEDFNQLYKKDFEWLAKEVGR